MATPNKPTWPYPDVAITIDGVKHYARLWPNPNGQWCKKHKKKPHYFGLWADPDTALSRWRAEWPAIISGKAKPQVVAAAGVPTLENLCEEWLHAKAMGVKSGELSSETFRKYRIFANRLVLSLGKPTLATSLRPADFNRLRGTLSGYSIYHRSDYIATIRGMFKWADASGLIDSLPDFGPEFVQPKRRVMRQARRANADKLMPRSAIRRLIRCADPDLKPVILLGINCGMKSMDIARIDTLNIDLRRGVISGHRHKTGSDMLAPLWPETIAAIKAVAHDKPPTLRTSRGLLWNGRGTDRVARRFAELRDQLHLRQNFTQGALRHTLRTVGGRLNRDATRLIMGQLVGDVLDETYDHDDKLPVVQAVSEYVRAWVFKPSGTLAAARHASLVARWEARGAKKSASPSASTSTRHS